MSSIAQKIDIEQETDEILKKAKIQNFDDYMALPEINRRYEIIDGEIIMSPAPNIKHHWIGRSLFRLLDRYVEKNRLGDIFWSPIDIKIPSTKFRTRQPDLLFISKERSGFTDSADSADGIQLLNVAPELVVEVLSQSDTPKIISEKLKDYRKIGVDECWLVDPKLGVVKVLKLSSDGVERIGIFSIGDKVQSEVLPELELQVDKVFE